MTHTPRTLSLVAALLLTLAACTDDLTQTTATTPDGNLAGQPVQLSTTALSVTPAGSPQTRATEPETDFPAKGTTMTVYLLEDDGTPIQQADYTYSTDGWTSTAPLRWPASTGTYRFTAISPAAMAGACTDGTTLPLTLPTEWTAADLATYAQLRTTSEATQTAPTTSGVTLNLHHPLAKIQVISTSSAPVYLTDAPASGTVTLDGTPAIAPTTAGLMQLATTDNALTYQGYVLPTTAAFGILADKLLTLTLPAGGLQAGTSLTTSDMPGIDITEFTLIPCTTPGTLASVWPADTPATKVLITGTLNADDISTLNSHNEITHLYITANVEDNTDWEDLDFYGSSSITEIYLAQATNIGSDAFFDCTSLTSVNLPKATNIGSGAFFDCISLTSVSLPKATNIGSGAFFDCTALASVSLPQATDIGSSAFYGCTSLTSVSLPQATDIGSSAFSGCTSLTSICLPTGVQFIFSPFDGCSKLTTLYLSNYYPEEEFDATTYHNYGEHTWQHIYYGYRGTGDYLDPASYTGHWPDTTTNP